MPFWPVVNRNKIIEAIIKGRINGLIVLGYCERGS